MKQILALLMFGLLATAAQAQIKCWNDASGKRVCGDTPPAGARTKTIQGPAAGSAPADPAAKDSAKEGPKAPMTAAEREQDYRKRQLDAKKAAEKADQERQDAAARKEGCSGAREYLASLQAGGRIPRMGADGERYFLDEGQIAAEISKTQQLIKQQGC